VSLSKLVLSEKKGYLGQSKKFKSYLGLKDSEEKFISLAVEEACRRLLFNCCLKKEAKVLSNHQRIKGND
jgi:hypothetical protein